ncbi:MAG TPA: hypothetical protein PLL32_02205 [Anaeromyxobacteraceae bacterium]|nr:hypothetical protein [Anaeromyxobacteraceae bacterium]
MLLPLLAIGLVLSQAEPPQAPDGWDLRVDSVVLSVGGTEDDGAIREQLRRVLPAAVRSAARWGSLPPSVALTVHATHAGLEDATGRRGRPWMRAWARTRSVDLQSPRSWSRGRATDAALGQILAHELTHCALFEATGRDGRARAVPPWFVEGMASVAAGERHDQARVEGLTDPLALQRADPVAFYGTADRAFRELVARFGEPGVRRVVSRLGEGRAFPDAFEAELGVTPAAFEADLVRRLTAMAEAVAAPAPPSR